MTFTDDDLKGLKDYLAVPRNATETERARLLALIARLDCAEHLIKALKNKENVTEEEIAWEKSCGR